MPGLGRGHAFPRRRRLYPERFSAAPSSPWSCFPTLSQGPAIVAEVMRSNVQVPLGLRPADGPAQAEVACQQGTPGLSIVGALGPRRLSRWAHAAGGRFRHAQPPAGLMRRRPRLPMALASGPKPSGRRLKVPISTSPQESLSWSPIAFTHTRALLPHSPGERPGPAHAKTPTPRI